MPDWHLKGRSRGAALSAFGLYGAWVVLASVLLSVLSVPGTLRRHILRYKNKL